MRKQSATIQEEALQLCGGSGWRREIHLKIRETIIEAKHVLMEKIAKYPKNPG